MRPIEKQETSSASTITRRFPVDGADADLVDRAIAGMDGVKTVKPDRDGKGVRISYDAARTGYADIEQALEQAGFALEYSRWTKIKAAWFGFVDENARGNATHKGGACCNHPPGIYGNQHKP